MKKIGLGIAILLFAIIISLCSSGMGLLVIGIGIVGLIFSIIGFMERKENDFGVVNECDDMGLGEQVILSDKKSKGGQWTMNILNNQIGSIYDRQKNLYSKYLRYSQQNAESKKVCGQEKITATSGKDVLCITKGDKENSYIVHFSDSAMVSRAVARGYVTVNGADVELTEDTKRQLLKVDKEASAAREKAYQDYVMQYEMAVAKQQSEAWRKALDGVPDSLRMLLEINNTENVKEREFYGIYFNEYHTQKNAQSSELKELPNYLEEKTSFDRKA